jgi:hypothetical protein
MIFLKKYLYNLALSFDQMVNAILLGDPDESISGRCGRAILSGQPKWWVVPLANHIDWMFLVLFKEQNHVLNAVEYEENPHEKQLWEWTLTDKI